jgi:hypothetical protein
MNGRRIRWLVLALAGLALMVGLAQPTVGRADGNPPLPTPSIDPKKGGPGGNG